MPIPFSDAIIALAWQKSGGRCEGILHQVSGFPRPLLFNNRGMQTQWGWEAHHRDPNGPPLLNNCQILCQLCHKRTANYGRSS